MDLRTQLNERANSCPDAAFRFEMPVRWGDLDALKHVNNTVYFRFMEEARTQYALACGMLDAEKGHDIVLANVSCDFLRPILWPATVVIDSRLLKVGRSSIECGVEMSVKGEEGLCARATTVVVGVASSTGRSAPWTDAQLQGMLRVFFPAT